MKKILLFWVCMILCITLQTAGYAADSGSVEDIRKEIAGGLAQLDRELGEAAGTISKVGLQGEAASMVLRGLCKKLPYATDCATVDDRGKIVTVEPAVFKKYEGADISGQEQVRAVGKTKRPILSRVFLSVEGFPAVDAEYPVFSKQKLFIGSVSVLFKPEIFLSRIVPRAAKDLTRRVHVIQTDGLILYDPETEKTGKSFFADGQHKQAPERRISGERRGAADVAGKAVDWTTVRFYGLEWRIVSIEEPVR